MPDAMTTEGTSSDGPVHTAPIRVFLLDDHEIVRRGIAELLSGETDIEVVGEAATVAEALRRVPAVRPDVAVLDARLPDGIGWRSCGSVATATGRRR